MKTIDNLRQYFPVITISLIFLASSFEASAQYRRNDNRDRDEYRETDSKWKGREDGDNDRGNWNKYASRYDRHPKYSKKFNPGHSNYFEHPRYGRVYNRFDRNPIVFSHRMGDYYYYNDHFYRYNDGIGYCVVEPPRNVYFSYLPEDCRRVHINGHVFFRVGDLYFQTSSYGYAMVPSPLEVHISARF